MKQLSWRTDGNGLLLGVAFHDANLTGLAVDQTGQMTINARASSGNKIDLQLSGVEDLRLEEFLAWPIIHTIFIWKVSEVPEIIRNAPDNGWGALFGKNIREQDRHLEERRIVDRTPQAYLFVLHSSYGGLIAATCEEIRAFIE